MSFKNRMSLLAVVLAALFLTEPISARTCGTNIIGRHQQELRTKQANHQKPAAKRKAYSGCEASAYYDTVLSQKTEHFQIFYTLNGPHQTTPAYVDTVAKIAEYAYQFYTAQMGMLPPLGDEVSFHYQQNVGKGLYPIEIIDVDLMRATDFYLNGSCFGCYGVTISEDYSDGTTTLVVENDFRYVPEYKSEKDTIKVDGKDCIYDIASLEFANEAHKYSYVDQWQNGIRVTLVHELYHAVQLRYIDFNEYWDFWFEASASGVEEVAAPDIDDYFAYLPTMSKLENTPLDEMIEDYGAGILFLYLYNHVSPTTDKFIWEGKSKTPDYSFWRILNNYAQKNKLSADSLFQDFSVKLSFAGKRTNLLDTAQWISSDENRWPEFKHIHHDNALDEFSPSMKEHAYQFHNGGKPIVTDYHGKATAIAYMSGESQIKSIKTTKMADSLYTVWNNNPSIDSIIWVFSRYNDSTAIPVEIDERPTRAYPSPWREGNLCFASLPQSKKFIEIRTRRGDLVVRDPYNSQTHCIDENRVKKLMVPGVYRFRAGSSGKTKDFIVIY
uniref:Uncharacterized protein n=1 Tax=uncultured bacterium fosmid pJB95A1 TaxID=1478075 RepID=A0A0H3UAT6_9BACT|nr:hypothetical protein [uncultured bacterium fosmid pJB95A1]